jgi:hypothetical protein
MAFTTAAGTSLHAANHQLWDDPTCCGPAQLPALFAAVQRVLALLISILACLAATDLDPQRRDGLGAVVRQLRAALSRLSETCEPGPAGGGPES